MSDCDLAIVGGGVAGLVAACEAARAGLSVRLFEAAADLGGRARTRTRREYAFNQGPHALYAGGAFRKALDDLGVAFTGAPPALSGGKLLWGETFHPLPASIAALLTLTPLGMADRLQFARLLDQLGKAAFGPPGQSLRTFTSSLRPRVGRLVEALARLSTYANAPEEIDAHAALAQLALANAGVIYVDGGWATLVTGLADRAREDGARLDTGAEVLGLEAEGEAWRLRLGGERSVTARAVILAVEPAVCARLAPCMTSLADAACHAVPVRAVCLDLALSRLPAQDAGFALGVDEPLYLSVHSKSARLAPDAGAMIHAAWYLASNEAPTQAHIERLEWLVGRLQPGWRDVEVDRQRLAGITVAHDFPRPGRARPQVTVEAPAPLCLAGDWVGREGLLSDASAASGREAARAAVGAIRRLAVA